MSNLNSNRNINDSDISNDINNIDDNVNDSNSNQSSNHNSNHGSNYNSNHNSNHGSNQSSHSFKKNFMPSRSNRLNFLNRLNWLNWLKTNFSIKTKITLWYMLLITGLVIVFLSIIFYVSNNLVKKAAYENLIKTVDNSFTMIEYKNDELMIDKDLETFLNNIQLSILNSNKEFIYGNSPFNFEYNSNNFTPDSNKIDMIRYENKKWYVYEKSKYFKDYGNLWVRGVVESSVIENTLETILVTALIALPFFLVFAALSGYLISKNAFKPIDKIRIAAQKINDGNDLTKRINLGEGNENINPNDEIYKLANTFDNMFDKLQTSFDNEVQFTSDVSHELRTPISVIMTQSEFGKDWVSSIDEAKETFNIIFKESQKMSNLVAQLLTLARMDRGHQTLQLEEVNIGELIEIAVEKLKPKAADKNINFILNIDFSIYSFVDEIMITRCFVNLISNAISYGRENGFIKINLHSENSEHSNIIFTIEDNGIGISKENITKIWTRFYQVDSSRTTDNSGLGLSMVKWIIEAHKGTIHVESTINKGTTFYIKLPYKK